MPTQRTQDIWLATEGVNCPEPGCAAQRGMPYRRLDGGEGNRRKNNNAHRARILAAKNGLARTRTELTPDRTL
jgi:hypothetical protein